jgi:betaine-aldehyde dehydrogenase
MITRDVFLIGSSWASPKGSGLQSVVSPATEEVIGTVPESTNADVDAAVSAARDAFENGPWPRMDFSERADYMSRIGQLLTPRIEEAVRLQIDEMGGPRVFVAPVTSGTVGEIPYVIEAARRIETREIREGSTGKVVVMRDPIGVVAGIIPWNVPIASVVGKMLPALLSGCPIIVKPAPETPLSAYLVAEAAVEVGLPAGVLSIVPGGREVGEYLVSHPGVDRVSFTGSSAVGARVAALCGEHLKSVNLELGGKSAAIVLADASVDRHLSTLIGSSMPNNGQVCFATTRILVPRERSAEWTERLVEAVEAMKIGDPQEADTDFGPLVASRQRERVEGYIRSGREQGATVALGGGRPAGLSKGWYVEPTIFTNVDNSMKIAREEIFGPVVCIIDYDNEADAVAIANDSEYGLGGAVFSDDVAHGLEVAARVQTGTCRINEAPPGGGGGPFGGVKRSGLGRENSNEGFESYYELKSIALPSGFVPTS